MDWLDFGHCTLQKVSSNLNVYDVAMQAYLQCKLALFKLDSTKKEASSLTKNAFHAETSPWPKRKFAAADVEIQDFPNQPQFFSKKSEAKVEFHGNYNLN